MQGWFPSAQNELQQTLGHGTRSIGKSTIHRHDFVYGVTGKVNLEKHFAQAYFIDENNSTPIEPKLVMDGDMLPVVTQQIELFHLYGKLRTGLLCKVWWKGERPDIASSAQIEIIGDEDWALVAQTDRPNELTIGPFRIFGGGLETGD